eukprot:TRINITY_DN1415_c0_g1_i1.p1 TRINITY_DN1415_c0_g1~~TRINITY_DN1415_c0_g1_i1.p1  ORF type:complete len:399 (+),score=174.44 TRINITY_DN1415_c0_g1_i1:43-1239(+)
MTAPSAIPRASEKDERFPGVKPLLDTADNINQPIPKKEGVIRVWVDGCFDMLHFGHANALRQAALLGHELYVGIHNDAEVIRFKGPPIMSEKDRYAAARACKWVSRVIEDVPYVTDVADIEKYEIDYVVHGDDLSTDLNGNNSYQAIIDIGKFLIVKRTEGISTTDLVGRMLLVTKNHHVDDKVEDISTPNNGSFSECNKSFSEQTVLSNYLTSTRKILQFSNQSEPKTSDKIVYVDGGFDCFHCGHAELLKKAREYGDYVIVGLHTDTDINRELGKNYPIMNMNERVLGVLSCRYADEVIMGVPRELTSKLIQQLKISVVVSGSTGDATQLGGADPYAMAKEAGIHQVIQSPSDLTTDRVIMRVIEQRLAFEERQRKKIPKDEKTNKNMEGQNVQEL